jgi:hypothetical protein
MKLNDRQTQYANMVVEEARRQGVNPQLALSVAFAENSPFNPNAVSPKGAIGIMQLIPSKAEELGVDPYDVTQNIEGGIRLLKNLNTKFEGDSLKVVVAYNAGENKDFFKTGDLDNLKDETLEYVTKIAGYNGGQIPSVLMEKVSETASPNEVATQEQVTTQAPSQTTPPPEVKKPRMTDQAVDAAKKGLSYYDPEELEMFAGIAGAGVGALKRKPLAALAQRSVVPPLGAAPSAAPTAPTAAPTAPQARPGPVRPPLGGTGTQNYARAFGLGDIEAGRAADMTKQAGGVHDLTTKRAAGLQKINELFPNQFREDPRFGGLMTPQERPGPGPRGPAGRVGGGKSPPLVKPPGPLKQITSMFQDMASGYPKAARNLSVAASKAPLVSYPFAGFNIGSEGMAAARELSSENPDYLEAALSGMSALGTGLAMYPPTAPFGIPMAAVPPIVRYFRDRPPEEEPSLGLMMP